MKSVSRHRWLPVLALAVAALAAMPAQAGPFGSLVVFGDSLSDNGNNAAAGLFDPSQVVTGNAYIPSNTYASGVYSNGPVWATSFASLIGVPLAPSLLGGSDYAFGGATTGTPGPGPGGFPFSLTAQTSLYLGATGGVAPSDALYVVAGGGNDARAALTAIAAGADAATTIASTAASFAADIGGIVDRLQAAGAQHIVVWDAPNLGLAPAVVAGGAAAAGSFLSATMNAALATRLAGEADVSTFDLFGFATSIAASPAAFGFSNTTDACGAVAGADCSQYVFWDGIHPTAAAHEAIADALFAVAAPIPEPETFALLAVGLAVVGWTAKRRRKG